MTLSTSFHWVARASAIGLCVAVWGQPAARDTEKSGEPIVIGERRSIQSEILKEPRPLLVAKPAGYESETERYPVLYLLDGDEHFHHVTGIVSFLAESGRIPKLLVVAVPNTNRTRDLTPPSKAEIDLRFSPGGGGADAFLRFLGDELVPYVEKNYRTRPYRILVGHSFGGLFAIHAMITRPKLFNAYIAIDPSLSWNNQAPVSQAEAFFETTKELQSDLYMTATSEGGGIRKLAGVLEENAPKGFRWKFYLMPEETHVSIPHRSIYQGLDTIFDAWHLTNPLELYDKGGIDAVHRHFREGGKRLGYDRTTSAFTISMIVAGLMQAGRLEEAASVLLHDPKAYPPPWNQLDALARAYAKRGDTVQVVRYYTLSLKENPRNEWARKKLAELGVDPATLPPLPPK